MIAWITTDDGVAAVGRSGSVALTRTEWKRTQPDLQLPYPADSGIAGRLRTLELDAPVADGTPPDGQLPPGEHVVETVGDDGPTVAVRVEGPATLTTDGATTRLRFPDRRPVAIAAREPAPRPETLTVPRTPSGLAAAVTAAGSRIPDGPERSLAPNRPHPPVVEYGTVDQPSVGDRPIDFRVPADLEHVLVAAPLAYYLGAALDPVPDATPLVSVPETGFEYAFSSLPSFGSEVADALRRVVHLDHCVREPAVEGALPLTVEDEPLDALGLDGDAARAVSPGVRYATFLEADGVDLPEWHLSTYVEADYDRARALPALLERLSLVYPAEATEMSPRELVSAALDEFHRGVVSIDPLAPELGVGARHGWLADGEVVDAFKTTPRAYEHTRRRRPSGDALSVAVVLNDPAMDDELAVADAYRARSEAVPLSVEVHESLTATELARLFERELDFLHYVGHCDADGLRCTDGALSVDALDRAGPRAFFLNACGSYREGEALVEKGSLAGGVTLEEVFNEQATRVGTAFGRLVVSGFRIDRALSTARRQIRMGRDYATVGDGTTRIAPAVGEPAILSLEEAENGRYTLRYDADLGAGGVYRDPFDGTVRPRGVAATTSLDRTATVDALRRHDGPVEFGGDLRSPAAVATELADRGSSGS
jgi:hypothetical protein